MRARNALHSQRLATQQFPGSNQEKWNRILDFQQQVNAKINNFEKAQKAQSKQSLKLDFRR